MVAALVSGAGGVGTHHADNKKVKEQKELQKMARDALHRLYKADPPAKAAVEGSAGYGIFNKSGLEDTRCRFGRGACSFHFS